MKTCRICGETKAEELFEISTISSRKTHRRNDCRACRKISRSAEKSLIKIHGRSKPIGTPCECCGRTNVRLSLDHDHDTEELRGWLCQRCNTAIGALGDNIEGLTKALEYLKRKQNVSDLR